METLYRTYTPELEVIRAAKGGDGRTVSGILVPFGVAQPIYPGLVEQFARGSFNHQLAAMHRVHYAYEHVNMGGVPVGRIHEASDDARGLVGAMRVSATEKGDELLTLIEDGVYSELSIGFIQRKPAWSRTLPDGTIERVKADLTEIASVLRGAYGQKAKVLAVRSEEGAPPKDDDGTAQTESRERAARAAQLLARLPVLPLG